MKLFYCAGDNGVTNFGDELNHLIWRKYLPGAFDAGEETQFIGIGTLLNDRVPDAPRTVIFGTGVGYYGPPRLDPRWAIYALRGPLSAGKLGLSKSMAVTDPGALVARLVERHASPARRVRYAFMPHWQSAPDAWGSLCEAVGIGFIDPRWPPDRVLGALRSTETLITEAMHGAIVADAMRVPWIAVRTRRAIYSFKWDDWSQSMELRYGSSWVPPLSPEWRAASSALSERLYGKLVGARLLQIAKTARPMLSRETVLESRLSELEHRLDRLRVTELEGSARASFA